MMLELVMPMLGVQRLITTIVAYHRQGASTSMNCITKMMFMPTILKIITIWGLDISLVAKQ